VQQYTPDGRLRYDGLQVAGATPAAITAARAALGLPTSTNPDQANVSSNGDIQAYNPSEQNWNSTVAFSVGRTWGGLDVFAAYVVQDGKAYGGVSEFGTTEGGNGSSGLQADQDSARDPNASVSGRASNVIKEAYKLEISYKREFLKGYESRFTLFGESRSGRPISFQMSDPNIGSGRSQIFGVWRDDQLLYVPNLSSPVAVSNPNVPGGTAYQVTTGNTVVFFKDLTTLNQFKSLVNQFGLPQGQITPKGYGNNPRVNRFDFQYQQELPAPVRGHKLIFTADVTNLGNLLNKKWGLVREYSSSRAGTSLINVSCAAANGAKAVSGSPVCSSYYYEYSTVNAATAAKPTIIDTSSLWSVELGLKYKF
jgi:hypothetical protein